VQPLALDVESALHAARLPALHRDPFDRLLVAQAIVHGLVLLTPDEDVRRYPVRTLW
jgi:PIN domain nuclease of toxin-antitoxin system